MVKSQNNKSYFMYVKTFSSDLEVRFARKWDFICSESDFGELVGPMINSTGNVRSFDDFPVTLL